MGIVIMLDIKGCCWACRSTTRKTEDGIGYNIVGKDVEWECHKGTRENSGFRSVRTP